MKQLLIGTTEEQDIAVVGRCFEEAFRIRGERTREGFRSAATEAHPDLVFIDVRLILGERETLPVEGWRAELQALRDGGVAGPLVMLAPVKLLREAVKAVKLGASNYLTSPVDSAEASYITESLHEFERIQQELDYLRDRFWAQEAVELVRTVSPLMRETLEKIKMVAPSQTTVLLNGETGVGKSTFAKVIHQHSTRRDRQFISVHCGAIPDTLIESELFGHEKGAFTGAVRRKPGKFEIAHGGTIFLDEVGLLTPAAQVKLLNVIQDRLFQRVGGETDIRVDVRIIAATNSDLKELRQAGTFRSDLYYRLNVFPIEIPPLRERKEDIPHLVRGFLRRLEQVEHKDVEDVDPAVLEAFVRYDWPGNVRELENVVERAFILETADVLTPQSFPADLFPLPSPEVEDAVDARLPLAEFRRRHIEAIERQYLERVLTEHRGRIAPAAAAAGIGVRQLHKLLTRHGIRKDRFKTHNSES
jgi:DNA-binding NtrC family response regulator